MEFNSNKPIYIQIGNKIKNKIIKGEIELGSKMDSVRDLALELQVNPNTISRAYQELEREGLLYKERGMGTYLTKDKDKIESLKRESLDFILDDFIKSLKLFNYSDKEILEIISKRLKDNS